MKNTFEKMPDGLRVRALKASFTLIRWLTPRPTMEGLSAIYRVDGSETPLESRQRIRALLDRVRGVSSLAASLHLLHGKEESNIQSELEAAIAEINELLQPYYVTPTLSRHSESGQLRFALEPKKMIFPSYPAGEVEAAIAMVELAGLNVLHLLTECECGSWFLSYKEDDRCSKQCVRRRYEKTEGYRARRREYARKYYEATVKSQLSPSRSNKKDGGAAILAKGKGSAKTYSARAATKN